MQISKGLRVHLRHVPSEDPFRPSALQGWLQVRGAKPDDRPFPSPPGHIVVLDGFLALNPCQETKRTVA